LGILHRRPPWGKNILFEEDLVDKFFQVPPEASAMGDLVFTVRVRTIIFRSKKCTFVLDWLQAPTHSWSLMALKTLLTESLSGMKCCSVL